MIFDRYLYFWSAPSAYKLMALCQGKLLLLNSYKFLWMGVKSKNII